MNNEKLEQLTYQLEYLAMNARRASISKNYTTALENLIAAGKCINLARLELADCNAPCPDCNMNDSFNGGKCISCRAAERLCSKCTICGSDRNVK